MRKRFRWARNRSVGRAQVDMDAVRVGLWNDARNPTSDNHAWESALLEQYRLYVEMTDRVSQRRGSANVYFLTLNSAAAIAMATLGLMPTDLNPWRLVFPTIILIILCVAWFRIVRSYKQLNTCKWTVVGVMEERLPASPWWSAEWQAMGAGKDNTLYKPLTDIEKWVPILFIAAYLGAVITAFIVH